MSILALILIVFAIICVILFFAALFKVSSENARREEGYHKFHPPDEQLDSQTIQQPLYRVQTVNRCVCCGEIIPEGRQVCASCEKGPRLNNGWY